MSMTVGLICCVDLAPQGRTVGEGADCAVFGIAVVIVLRGAVGVVDAATTTLLAGGKGELIANPITKPMPSAARRAAKTPARTVVRRRKVMAPVPSPAFRKIRDLRCRRFRALR
jgi:hypothetical protein